MPQSASILSGCDDDALALGEGHAAAKVELFDRYAHYLERILARILGHDAELTDLLHEVFVRALAAIDTLEDPGALKGWLRGIAVLTARESIRRRIRGRWLRFLSFEDLPEVEGIPSDDEGREALRATYAVLDRLGADDRIAFALRYIEGLELREVAAACNVSLNTIKRRLARAERRFSAFAAREPALTTRLGAGVQWKTLLPFAEASASHPIGWPAAGLRVSDKPLSEHRARHDEPRQLTRDPCCAASASGVLLASPNSRSFEPPFFSGGIRCARTP
jgi:RNA polymerase sigma-70 factor, ECF subfamily